MRGLQQRLFDDAIRANATFRPALYSVEVGNVSSANLIFRMSSQRGPFVGTVLVLPGSTTFPASATVELRSDGNKAYTRGAVQASAVSPVAAGALSAPEALGMLGCLPAPIVIDANGHLLASLRHLSSSFAAGSTAQLYGFHTDEDFAAAIAASGELWAAQLQLDLSTGTPFDAKELAIREPTTVANWWLEETTAGGAVLEAMHLEINGDPVIRTPQVGYNAAPKHPGDPRSFLGALIDPGSIITARAESDAAGAMTERLVLTGSCIYGNG